MRRAARHRDCSLAVPDAPPPGLLGRPGGLRSRAVRPGLPCREIALRLLPFRSGRTLLPGRSDGDVTGAAAAGGAGPALPPGAAGGGDAPTGGPVVVPGAGGPRPGQPTPAREAH